MESDHNFQLTQYKSNIWQQPLTKFFRAAQYYQHQQMNYEIKGQLWDKTSLKWMIIKGQD